MNKKDKKNLKKRLLDIDSWLNEPIIEIPDDWKNKIEVMVKELEDSILVEKNDSYDVGSHEIEKFVDWKARIDETMKKIEDLILVEKNENYDVDKHIKDLSNLHDFEFKNKNLAVRIFNEFENPSKFAESFFINSNFKSDFSIG